jgi:hypothetical protein
MKMTKQPQIPTPFVKGFNPWACWYPALGNRAVGRGNPQWLFTNNGMNIFPTHAGMVLESVLGTIILHGQSKIFKHSLLFSVRRLYM